MIFKSEETRRRVSNTAKRIVKDRIKKQIEAIPFLIKCSKSSKNGSCVVCAEFVYYCLDNHHLEGRKKNKQSCVSLCASCHRIFDKGGGREELKLRRKRYYKYNLKYKKNSEIAIKAWKTRKKN